MTNFSRSGFRTALVGFLAIGAASLVTPSPALADVKIVFGVSGDDELPLTGTLIVDVTTGRALAIDLTADRGLPIHFTDIVSQGLAGGIIPSLVPRTRRPFSCTSRSRTWSTTMAARWRLRWKPPPTTATQGKLSV